MADARYCIEYAKTGRSGCKKCKQPIEKGSGRIGKITANPFSDDGGDMKVWFHVRCIFETFKRARAATKKVESPADLEGFPDLRDEEKEEVKTLIKEFVSSRPPPKKAAKGRQTKGARPDGATPLPTKGDRPDGATSPPTKGARPDGAAPPPSVPPSRDGSANMTVALTSGSRDDTFEQFCCLCEELEREPSYNAKTRIVSNYLKLGSRGCSGGGLTGSVYLLLKLLLPTAGTKRVYNLQSKQMVKVLSLVFGCSLDAMVEDLDQGDVAETARKFFEDDSSICPAKNSTLSLADVDSFLDRLTAVTREEEQKAEFLKIIGRCTATDLRFIVRLIKHDLRINAGPKHILDALDPNAYAAFQASHDLIDVVERVLDPGQMDGSAPKRQLSIRATIMTPIKPMLAEACRSVGMAIKKCPSGMFAEIKYDGERVQVHKQGDLFQYFSRSLKPVQSHKVAHIKDFLPRACPHGDSMILDCEVLMVDNKTGKPLPFGTLGIHKKSAFQDATCCLFIFDIVHFNGETLLSKPLQDRRHLLERNVTEVKNRIMLSEQTLIKSEAVLSELMMGVIKQGLEGLVLKDVKGMYEPGKRHWLKMKKDYLEGGAMADTADLLVLGAYFGTGSKGGMMSVFLMGTYDHSSDVFKTVAKCGNGHDDATIARLQTELDMVKISKDPSKVPSWLSVNRTLVPDFVIRDPKSAPVWEITGAEFTNSTTHTADGVSIRFPRVTRIRTDKDWSTATNLQQLKVLFATSKETVDIPSLMSTVGEAKPERGGGGGGRGEGGKKRVKEPASQFGESPQEPSPKKQKAAPLAGHSLECTGLSVPEPLMDIFLGLKLYVAPGVPRAAQLQRFLTAYGGEVMDQFQASAASYVIAGPAACKASEGVPCLDQDWVWDCLQKKQLLPKDNYLL